MIDKAIQIAEKEWESLRYSFETCGDIGDFNFDDLKSSRWLIGPEYQRFISNITKMDKKLSQYGYATLEALSVFTVLASIAAEKLGLKGELASAFGMGYGCVRTGLLVYHKLEPRQILFYKMFFPLGGVQFHWDRNWDFDPFLVKIKIVFERFMNWQNNPQLYTQDFTQFQNIGEGWKEWDEMDE